MNKVDGKHGLKSVLRARVNFVRGLGLSSLQAKAIVRCTGKLSIRLV